MTPEAIQQLELGKMELKREFSVAERNPFEFDIYGRPINYVKSSVNITDDRGKIIFTQPNVEHPDSWSDLAVKVVASKYFWGNQEKGERENSTTMLISRVAEFFKRQALIQKYFSEEQANILRDEISAICLNQLCVFNSPVWFNAGINSYDKNAGGVSAFKYDLQSGTVVSCSKGDDRPQCSACFIQSVEDNMDSIMALQVSEANLFKAGSGTGTNRSSLRSSKERLTGGGWASGPLSFMKGYDTYAGVIKSGGKTRRAAKMEILNIDHPDIIEFIEAKPKEEKKAWALIEQGYPGGFNGEAYSSIFFQNCNMSVRISDKFMQAVKENGDFWTRYVTNGEPCESFKAKDMLKKIAEGTYICGDPGVQYDGMINKWNTCKNTGRINATNPCSEYVFLDNTACNLASANLMKFRKEDGTFDVENYKKVIRTVITCMELAVDGSSYPTDLITQNSHDFRPLGLGYANLGALLMSFGFPYDSDEGRSIAAVLTSILCGQAYKSSAELAALVGPFPGYERNKEPMMEVMKMHRSAIENIDESKVPKNLRYLMSEARQVWDDAVELGERFGYRNSQATVIAPTGTIAFMMDCDTTGIEPDIALVKYKNLAGGGMLKIVNKSVGLALKTLGYEEKQINEILDYVNQEETIEGAPHLKNEHIAVFDCAFKPAKGKRSIHYVGHIKMMSAIQPFLSGAISKTVNMPESATVSDIEEAYAYGWEMGLKALAIYRENSKRSQPLNTSKTEGEMVKGTQKSGKNGRIKLPQTRKSIVHKFDIAGHEGYLIVGLYDKGKPGEIFVTMSKEGSTIRGLMDAWATSVSINLQYGVPLVDLFKKFRHQKFEPSGFVKNVGGGSLDSGMSQIRTASSIVDYVSQFMLTNFGDGAGGITIEAGGEILDEKQKSIEDFGNEGLVCQNCGGPAKRIGNCEVMCTSCNITMRSGCGE